MLRSARGIGAAAIASFLIAATTAGVAAMPAAQPVATEAAASPANPWLTLSAMTSTSANAANTTTARTNAEAASPPREPLAVMMATLAMAIWILLDQDDDGIFLEPVSP